MGRYSRTRRRVGGDIRVGGTSVCGTSGESDSEDDGGGGGNTGGYNISTLTNGKTGNDCDTILSCSAGYKEVSQEQLSIIHDGGADETLWTRSKNTTIIPQRKGQRPLQLCFGNCPNGPTTPPLSSSAPTSLSSERTADVNANVGPSIRRESVNCTKSKWCGGGGGGAGFSSQSHSSSRWKPCWRLFALFPNNFYHHRHSLRSDFFGQASLSFTLLCGSILILLGSRNDLLGQCVKGDEISEADKPTSTSVNPLKPKEAVSNLVAIDGIPFRVIAKSSTLRSLFNSTFEIDLPKSPSTIREWVLSTYQEKKSEIVEEIGRLKHEGQKFSLTLDEWTSTANHRYLNVNLHTTEKFWNLGLTRIKGSFTSNECLSLVTSILLEHELELQKDIFGVVTDGAAMMKRFGQISGRQQQLCYAHGIHLAVTDILYEKGQPGNLFQETEDSGDENECEDTVESELFGEVMDDGSENEVYESSINEIISQVRTIVRAFRKSPCKMEILEKYSGVGSVLILDTRTRWNSLFAMLERFMFMKEGILKTLIDLHETCPLKEPDFLKIHEIIKIPVEHVEGVLRTQVKLPCNVSVPTRDDKLHMVLWFRDRDGEPIYRYDVRDKAPADAKRWSLEDRLFFQVMFDPAHLSIQNLDMRDEGVYRCRVDFKNSPTRNIRVNLTIVVPPEQPVIFDTNGIVTMKHVGPYNEGSDLILTCEVAGGRPKPKLTWWLGNSMIDGDYTERNDGILINKLVFPRLNRHHLSSEFVCQAVNTNQAMPPSTKVMVNINLRPLQTTITTMDSYLLAERRYSIECITVGSRPPAVITWWKNSRQISQLPSIPPSEDKNVTRSILDLIPAIEDDGKILICRGDNPWIPGSAMEARWRLNVHYAPRVYLKLGDNLIPDDIKEGDDVYFECSVQSNPPHTRLNWFHEGREVRHNATPHVTQKVIISNNRLVLQKVSRHIAGNYTCSAKNSEGSSQSNILPLRVKYVPTCKSNTEGLIGAMKKETVQVICEMAADPPKVEFHWTFNNSGVEVIHVSRSRFTYKGTQSVLNYTPISEMDYGTLQCWGSNDVGKGLEGPCIFQIVSAGRPFPPRNCTIFNHTEDSLNIACVEGFDGGLPQNFVLEVVDFTAKKIKLNASSKMPSFSVEGMEPGVVFRFIVYAVNAKGRSEPFILDGISFRGVAKLKGQTSEGELELNPLYAVIVGCFVVLIVFLIVAIIAVWKRSRRRKPPVAVKAQKRDSENSNNFQTGDAALTKIDQSSVEDIGNPDVVPNKSDRSGGIRGFIRIHKTPPARRRKKDLEVKNNGETVALTLAETPDGELHRNHHNHHRPSILTSSNHVSSAARESRI